MKDITITSSIRVGRYVFTWIELTQYLKAGVKLFRRKSFLIETHGLLKSAVTLVGWLTVSTNWN